MPCASFVSQSRTGAYGVQALECEETLGLFLCKLRNTKKYWEVFVDALQAKMCLELLCAKICSCLDVHCGSRVLQSRTGDLWSEKGSKKDLAFPSSQTASPSTKQAPSAFGCNQWVYRGRTGLKNSPGHWAKTLFLRRPCAWYCCMACSNPTPLRLSWAWRQHCNTAIEQLAPV
jgi:hypothetical protein